MATTTAKQQAATTKKQAKRTTATARSSARRTSETAKQSTQRTAAQARRVNEAAQRTVKTLVTDSGYAAVGLSDTAIAFARTLPGKLTSETPKVLEETPRRVEQRLETLRRNAERDFNTYAERGRNIIDALTKSNSAGQRAGDQARNARTQFKAALTSFRKAAGSGAEAVENTVENAGRQAEREQYEAMTVAELQDLARRKGIENRSEKNKRQLVNALLSA